MLPSNLKPSAHFIADADGALHHPTLRSAEECSVPTRANTVSAARNLDPSVARPQQGNRSGAGLPDMEELWCNCDD